MNLWMEIHKNKMVGRFSFVVFMLLWSNSNGNSKFLNNVIDVDDILSEDFMPGALLVLENPTTGIRTFNESLRRLQSVEKPSDGSFGNAMETLNFHRSMMNQYLCRNYVAEQIVSDMTTSRIRRRMGHVTPGAEEQTMTSKIQLAVQNNLLNDEGSAGYKDWLSKSTTLEDIYRHYEQPQDRNDDFIEEDEKDEDFDEEYNGHVTGYVYSNEGHGVEKPPKHRGHTGLGMYYAGGGGYPYPNAVYHNGGSSGYHGGGSGYHGGSSGYNYGGSPGYQHGGDSGYHPGGDHGDGGGYSYHDHDSDGGGGHSAYDGVHAIHEHEHVYHSYPPKYHHEESYSSKEHDLADLFDIALTALAFLSFGMFIVHVIMCISAAGHTTTTMANMMMPMSMGPTSTGTGGMTTSTGNGGGGMGATGGGGSDTGTGNTGGGASTGGGTTNTEGGTTSTENSDNDDGGMGMEPTATGGGDMGGGDIDMGDGDIDGGGGTGGGENAGGGSTGSTAPDTGTGTGTGTTGTDEGTDNGEGENTGTGMDGDDGAGTGAGKDTFKFRLRRDIPTITNPNNQLLNELARKVLVSIEAALVANNDRGVCLRKSLCENNKFSRTLDGRDKLIFPMWSLGMSWLSGRLVKDVPPATSMLDTLKASILGLGRANCEVIYQECDLRREVTERRKRRRKRNTG